MTGTGPTGRCTAGIVLPRRPEPAAGADLAADAQSTIDGRPDVGERPATDPKPASDSGPTADSGPTVDRGLTIDSRPAADNAPAVRPVPGRTIRPAGRARTPVLLARTCLTPAPRARRRVRRADEL